MGKPGRQEGAPPPRNNPSRRPENPYPCDFLWHRSQRPLLRLPPDLLLWRDMGMNVLHLRGIQLIRKARRPVAAWVQIDTENGLIWLLLTARGGLFELFESLANEVHSCPYLAIVTSPEVIAEASAENGATEIVPFFARILVKSPES